MSHGVTRGHEPFPVRGDHREGLRNRLFHTLPSALALWRRRGLMAAGPYSARHALRPAAWRRAARSTFPEDVIGRDRTMKISSGSMVAGS